MLVVADNNPVRHIRRPYVNWTLIALCVGVFVLNPAYQDWGFTPANLHLVGNPKTDATWSSIAVQSVSHIFLHGSIWHRAGNMVVLWVFGNNIEDSMGHGRYPLFFLLCGMGGALAEGLFSPAPGLPVIGASGAIAGVMGAYLLLHPRASVLVLVAFRVPVLIPASLFVGLSVTIDLLSALSPDPDAEVLVAWWAHLGGFAAGVLLILVLRYRDVPLFQPATAYPADRFGRLSRLMINLGPRGDMPASGARRMAFWLKTIAFFAVIVVVSEYIFL